MHQSARGEELRYEHHTICVKNGNVVGYVLKQGSPLTTAEGVSPGCTLSDVQQCYGEASDLVDMRQHANSLEGAESYLPPMITYHGKQLQWQEYDGNKLLWYNGKAMLFVIGSNGVVVAIHR
jgi:hypothetical protein